LCYLGDSHSDRVEMESQCLVFVVLFCFETGSHSVTRLAWSLLCSPS
jgi:hypothetical protein